MAEHRHASISIDSVSLNKMTKSELFDLRRRQDALLENKNLVNSLPDKGAKLKKKKNDIEAAIRQKSDDQCENVLKTLASNDQPNKVLLESTATTLVQRPSDAEQQIGESSEDPFIDDLTRKLEDMRLAPKRNDRLQFNKGVTDNPKSLEKYRARYFVNGIWIETRVTPPPSMFSEAKEITFQESYRLLKEQDQRQSELQFEQAGTQLAERLKLHNIDGFVTCTIPKTFYQKLFTRNKQMIFTCKI